MPNTEQLRNAIDTGKTGEKVAFPDPAAAPLGTDDEAAGTPPTSERVRMALTHEYRAPAEPTSSARCSFYSFGSLRSRAVRPRTEERFVRLSGTAGSDPSLAWGAAKHKEADPMNQNQDDRDRMGQGGQGGQGGQQGGQGGRQGQQDQGESGRQGGGQGGQGGGQGGRQGGQQGGQGGQGQRNA
jgi:hypothetical protein